MDADAERCRTATELGLVQAQASRDRAALLQSIQALQAGEAKQQQLALDKALLQYELLMASVKLLRMQGTVPQMQQARGMLHAAAQEAAGSDQAAAAVDGGRTAVSGAG